MPFLFVNSSCWIDTTTPTIWAFVVPVIIVIVANIAFLFIALRVVLSVKSRDRTTSDRVVGWLKVLFPKRTWPKSNFRVPQCSYVSWESPGSSASSQLSKEGLEPSSLGFSLSWIPRKECLSLFFTCCWMRKCDWWWLDGSGRASVVCLSRAPLIIAGMRQPNIRCHFNLNQFFNMETYLRWSENL